MVSLKSHSRNVESLLLVTINLCAGWHAAPVNSMSWPASAWIIVWVGRSHKAAVRSQDAVTAWLPPGTQSADTTTPVWPVSTISATTSPPSLPLSTSTSSSLPSSSLECLNPPCHCPPPPPRHCP